MKKTSSRGFLATAVATAALGCCAFVGAQTVEPPVPQGTFTVTSSSVPSAPTGAWSPKLNWNITYPQVVKEIVTIDEGGELTPKKNLTMDIRVIGAQIEMSSTWLEVQGQYKLGTGSWTNIWQGKHSAITSTTVPISNKAVTANTKVSFQARCRSGTSGSSSWNTMFTAGAASAQKNVRALVNGDTPPSYAPAYSQGSVKGCLQPYLDSAGKIKIGPKDVILIWELWGSDTKQTYFDMQDFVILVTFKETT